MKIIRFFCFLLLMLLISSCQKEKVTEEKKDSQEKQTQETILEPLFHVSEGNYSPEMIFVEGGNFIMGNVREQDNQPHEVELSSFYVASKKVTVAEWKEFLSDVQIKYDWYWEEAHTIGRFQDIIPTEDCPAQSLTWYYAVVFCNWASMKDGLEQCYIIDRLPEHVNDEIEVTWNKEANGYRLPTEAEWEYAARGGSKSKGYTYPGSNIPEEIGKFGLKASYPVGLYKPNELGIHEMGGNVHEWCWDWYDEVMYMWLPTQNPFVDNLEDVKKISSVGENLKVRRGNSWLGRAFFTEHRGGYPPKYFFVIGIRLVRNAG